MPRRLQLLVPGPSQARRLCLQRRRDLPPHGGPGRLLRPRRAVRTSLTPQCLQDEPRRLLSREVLLTGDQVAVAHREAPPQTGLDVVCAEFLELVLPVESAIGVHSGISTVSGKNDVRINDNIYRADYVVGVC